LFIHHLLSLSLLITATAPAVVGPCGFPGLVDHVHPHRAATRCVSLLFYQPSLGKLYKRRSVVRAVRSAAIQGLRPAATIADISEVTVCCLKLAEGL
jgi:hypothetical protein